jgi:hypothetical protein
VNPLNETAEVMCPFCGTVGAINVDLSGGSNQTFVEDCEVCCRPRVVHVEAADEDEVRVWVGRS